MARRSHSCCGWHSTASSASPPQACSSSLLQPCRAPRQAGSTGSRQRQHQGLLTWRLAWPHAPHSCGMGWPGRACCLPQRPGGARWQTQAGVAVAKRAAGGGAGLSAYASCSAACVSAPECAARQCPAPQEARFLVKLGFAQLVGSQDLPQRKDSQPGCCSSNPSQRCVCVSKAADLWEWWIAGSRPRCLPAAVGSLSLLPREGCV